MMQQKWVRKLCPALSLVLLASALSAGMGEIGLRLLFRPLLYDENVDMPRPPYVWCSSPEEVYQYDPVLGWSGQPGAVYLEWRNFEWFAHSYDMRGFRRVGKREGEPIIILGDSFVRGTLANDDETIPYLLNDWLENTSVYPLAAGAWGTGQELLAYRRYAEQIPHKAVVLVLYLGNDFFNNVHDLAGRRPMFDLVDGQLVQTTQPEKVDPGASSSAPSAPEDHAGVAAWLYRHSLVYRLVARTATRFRQPDEETARAIPRLREDDIDREILVTMAILRELAAETQRREVPLYVFALPARGEIHPSEPVRLTLAQGKHYWGRLREALESFAATNRDAVTYYDLTPELASRTNLLSRFYGRPDSHLNQRGYSLVARVIADLLVEDRIAVYGSLPRAPERRYRTRPPSCNPDGPAPRP